MYYETWVISCYDDDDDNDEVFQNKQKIGISLHQCKGNKQITDVLLLSTFESGQR